MSSAKQTKIRKCGVCFEMGHNKRTCPQINYTYSSPEKKLPPKQQMFFMERPIIELVDKILEKGFFGSKAEFYRHCVINELTQWIDLKELFQGDE